MALRGLIRSDVDPGPLAFIRSSTGFVLVLLSGIVLAFYSRLWLPDLVLIKRDAYRFFLPLKQYMVERLSNGELPQWFPYEGLGRPFIGVPVTGVFHPFSLLYLVLSGPDAYRLSTLLSCLIGALGAFALGRMLGYSRLGALISGLAFVLSGYVVSLTENIVYLYSVCLFPLFCAALEKALKGSLGWLVALSLLWATVFLNGDMQTGYYYGFIALAWAVARAPQSWPRAAGRVALSAVLTAILAGIQLGPAFAVFLESNRAQAESFHWQALYWATHPFRLLTIVASPVGGEAHPAFVSHLFFGTRLAGGGGDLWAESVYLGVPVLGLAMLGAWYRRDLRILTILGGLALLLALGRKGGLYEVFYHVVPLWSAFRYPERLMGIVAFAACMLAGAGADELRHLRGHPFLWFAAAGCCLVMGLALSTEVVTLWTAAAFKAPEEIAREVTGSAGVAFLYSAGAALCVALVALGLAWRPIMPELLMILLVLVILFDLFRANLKTYHAGPVEAATFTPGLVEAVYRHAGGPGPGRFRLLSFEEERIRYPKAVAQWLDLRGASSLMIRQALDLEHNAQFHLESIKYYMPGYSATVSPLMTEVWLKNGLEVAARFNVAYLIGRTFHFQTPRFEKSLVAENSDYELALVVNPVLPKPRAYLSRRPESVAAPVDFPALLARPDFLSGEVDVIEAPEGSLLGPNREGTVAVEHYEPELIQVRVDTKEPAVLVLLDAFEGGWRARLENNQAVPILRANGLVRAVIVPSGSHVITFTYETPCLREGAWASLLGGLICLFLPMYNWWRRGKREPGVSSRAVIKWLGRKIRL